MAAREAINYGLVFWFYVLHEWFAQWAVIPQVTNTSFCKRHNNAKISSSFNAASSAPATQNDLLVRNK